MSPSKKQQAPRRPVRAQRVDVAIRKAGRGVVKPEPPAVMSPVVDRLIDLVLDRLLLDLKCMSSKDDQT